MKSFPSCTLTLLFVSFFISLLPSSAQENLALHCPTYASSSYDYNLTAQLATDGTKSGAKNLSEICHIRVSTPEGPLPRREREWTLDQGPFSRNILMGSKSYLQYDLYGFSARPEGVSLAFSVAYEKRAAKKGYKIFLEASTDGQHWEKLAENVGKRRRLPGIESRRKVHSDPNKQSAQGTLPVRIVQDTLLFPAEKVKKDYRHFRLNVEMRGAAYWMVSSVDFLQKTGQHPIPADPQHAEDVPAKYLNPWFPKAPAGYEVLNLLPSEHFDSAWMTPENGNMEDQWLSVDLKFPASIERITPQWISEPEYQSLQISDDGQQWEDIETFPVKGQYVRLLIPAHESLTGEPYALSELEVWGRYSHVSNKEENPEAPKWLTASWKRDNLNASVGKAQVISLEQGHWNLLRKGSTMSIPATVPGTVLTSYIDQCTVPDPIYADNWQQISESYFNSDFVYTQDFKVSPKSFGQADGSVPQQIILNFDGINWKANVFLNDHFLGRIEGAFIRSHFDVTPYLLVSTTDEQVNHLRIEIERCAHPGAVKEKTEESTDFNGGILGADNPTFHASIGWDWINTVRGRNIGIWDDVYLTWNRNLSLHDPYVETVLQETTALVSPEIIVRNPSAVPATAHLEGVLAYQPQRDDNFNDPKPEERITFAQQLLLQPGEERVVRFSPADFPQLRIAQPHLWWPNGYGDPDLYTLRFVVKDEHGNVSDEHTTKVGLRQLTWSTTDDVLKLYINGRRFIGRGGNWGFSEQNLRYSAQDYETAVRYHRDMHFTMIRNWVGQTANDEFYAACDRNGIVVWQDFWLANPSDGPNPADEQLFMANAQDYARRIRHHACLGLWCGRNEGFPPFSLDTQLRSLVRTETPGLPYISDSASEVVSGHGPYHAMTPLEYFQLEKGRTQLHSERGMPAVMNYESFLETIGDTLKLWPQNHLWGGHDYTMAGAQRGRTFNHLVAGLFGEATSARQFCEWAQWINYDGYRALFESRSSHRKGLLLWMTHAAWPSMTWQTYDYFFDPTAAYFGCKHANEPLHIQYNPATEKMEVVNYSAGNQQQLKAKAVFYGLDGKTWGKGSAQLNIAEDSTHSFKLPEGKPAGVPCFLDLRLTNADREVVSHNRYLLAADSTLLQVPQANVTIGLAAPLLEHTKNRDFQTICLRIANTSDAPALMLHLQFKTENGKRILPVLWSDNYFHLLPGESRTIRMDYDPKLFPNEGHHVILSGLNVEETQL